MYPDTSLQVASKSESFENDQSFDWFKGALQRLKDLFSTIQDAVNKRKSSLSSKHIQLQAENFTKNRGKSRLSSPEGNKNYCCSGGLEPVIHEGEQEWKRIQRPTVAETE